MISFIGVHKFAGTALRPTATQASTAVADRSPDIQAIKPSDSVLQIRDLSGKHSATPAQNVFENINLDIRRAEIVCLLGSSGCGKSSLLRAIAGLNPHLRGEIKLNGRLVTAPRPNIGLVFQKPILFPWLNVQQNITFGLTLRQVKPPRRTDLRPRITNALAEVGLQASASLFPGQLSGGMAQRVALARVLARQPDLLLLDEPLSALDAITRIKLQKLLIHLIAKHRIATLWVTHDIDEALLVADRILLMDRHPGKIVAAWNIPSPKPRFATVQQHLNLRTSILAALSQVSGSQQTEGTL